MGGGASRQIKWPVNVKMYTLALSYLLFFVFFLSFFILFVFFFSSFFNFLSFVFLNLFIYLSVLILCCFFTTFYFY